MEEEQVIDLLNRSREVMAEMNLKIETLQKAAEFGKAVQEDKNDFSMNDAAKTLYTAIKEQTGKEIGQKRLFSILRELRILSDYSTNKNQPYDIHVKAGRFKVAKTLTTIGVVSTTRVTGKGLAYILEKILEYYK
jgi:anti-repressor protein